MNGRKVLKLWFLSCLCTYHCCAQQTYPHVSFMGQALANHGYVNLSRIGTDVTDSVLCSTDLSTCCSAAQGIHRGDWYFPNGSRLPFNGDISENRAAQRVYLRRNNNGNTTGIFRCDIPTSSVHHATDISVHDMVHVGIYNDSGGEISLNGITVDFINDGSRLTQQFTLTCISTGGPATTVTWTRDSTTLTEGCNTVLDDPVTAKYTHVVNGTEPGNYTCTVSNNKPSSNSSSITIQEADPIADLTLVQEGLTNISVSWTPTTQPNNIIGYGMLVRRCPQHDSTAKFMNTSNSYIYLSSLIEEQCYNISVFSMSQHLSSEIISDTLTLVTNPGLLQVDVVNSTNKSLFLKVNLNNYIRGGNYKLITQVTWLKFHSCIDDNFQTTTFTNTTALSGRRMMVDLPAMYSNSEYNITVMVSNVIGSAINYTIGSTKPSRPSKAPIDIEQSERTLFSVTITWGQVTCEHQNGNITRFFIKYEIDGLQKNMTVIDTYNAMIDNLHPSTIYKIQIAAINEVGIGIFEEIDALTSICGERQLQLLTLAGQSKLKMSVFWAKIISDECINYTDNGNLTLYDHNMYHIPNLVEFSTYNITVCIIGSNCNLTSITTDEAAPSAAPENVSVISNSPFSITLSWDAVPCDSQNGIIKGYSVVFRKNGSDDYQIKNFTSDDIGEVELTELDPSTMYEIKVAAFTGAGIGPFTDAITSDTMEAQLPSTIPPTTKSTTMNTDPTSSSSHSTSDTSTASSSTTAISTTAKKDVTDRGDIGGAVAGVVVSILLIIGASVGIILIILLFRRRRGSLKGIFPMSHLRVLPKQSSVPDPEDISMDQISIGESINIEESMEMENVGLGLTSTPLPPQNTDNMKVPLDEPDIEETKPILPEPQEKEEKEKQSDSSGPSSSAAIKPVPKPPAKEPLASTPLPVALFGSHVEKLHANSNNLFKTEFDGLSDGVGKPISIARSMENRKKNRFANISVYDDNRIVLNPLDEELTNDYINACYIDGYSRPKKFIAAQGPIPVSVVDFWRMIWQERVPTIVMITNLIEGKKTKCEQYWPSTGALEFGPFRVTITHQLVLADYTVRTLVVELLGKTRKVIHFHYTAWPDHGVPDYATSILNFHKMVSKDHQCQRGALLVHCSAGVGRTGTFIAIDYVLEQMEKEGVVDIPNVIQSLRQQRMNMVQTVDQYIFIHDAILESFTCGDTEIDAGDMRNRLNSLKRVDNSGRTGLEIQFAILEQVSVNVGEAKSFAAHNNPTKNRSSTYLPVDKWRVVLKGEHPDYIHASSIHGYKQQRAFIITQGPMKSTVRDFWKMVFSRKSSVVVMLSDLVELDEEVCYQYWPGKKTQTFVDFRVELLSEEKSSGFFVRSFSVMQAKYATAHQVWQFQVPDWTSDYQCRDISTIIRVIDQVYKIQRKTGNHPIIVHGLDTVSRSAMFCAVATTIERCKTEGVVDVFQVVKAMRAQKPGAIQTMEQYQSIFEALLLFIDSFETYSNFTS